MNITFTVNGLDLHSRLSTYKVTEENTYRKVITALDDTEYPYPRTSKTILTFSLLPMTDEESKTVYTALTDFVFFVTYTNPHTDRDETRKVRVTSDIESTFALLSVDGKRRYKGSTVQLREL